MVWLLHGRRKNGEGEKKMLAYVGCRTTAQRKARGKGIRVFEIDNEGQWSEIQTLKTLENPSYLTFDNKNEYLYAVHGDYNDVTSYQIHRETGKLSLLNQIKLEGGVNPVFITCDKTNQYLVAAALQGGAIYVIRRMEDGTLGPVVYTHHFPGKEGQGVCHAHQCMWDQTREFLFVPQQGRIIGYPGVTVLRFHPEDGSLEETDYFRARDYAEPRHIAVHPNNRYVYLVNEKDNTVTYFQFDSKTGRLKPLQIVPVLPETYVGQGQASGVLVDKSGRWVIESTRIFEAMTVFQIDPATGMLSVWDYVDCQGRTPRFITFAPDGRKFYAANEDSDRIVEYHFDKEEGRLVPTGQVISTESPVCLLFLP